jgi:hypothetical protein
MNNTDTWIVKQFVRSAIFRLTWRLPRWLLIVIVIGGYALLRFAH